MELKRLDQNREAIYQAACLLQDLNNRVVYVGGRIVGLLITDELEDDVRPTTDIDVAMKITNIVAHYSVQKELEALGFKPDKNINCRYIQNDMIIDVMYTDGTLQGINSNWYQDGYANAIEINIKNDKTVKIFNAIYFIASKLEAFHDRSYSNNDYWDCKDLEDIINVINGRSKMGRCN